LVGQKNQWQLKITDARMNESDRRDRKLSSNNQDLLEEMKRTKQQNNLIVEQNGKILDENKRILQEINAREVRLREGEENLEKEKGKLWNQVEKFKNHREELAIREDQQAKDLRAIKKYHEGLKALEQKLVQKQAILTEKEKELDEFSSQMQQEKQTLKNSMNQERETMLKLLYRYTI
jgi:hypothetical protein